MQIKTAQVWISCAATFYLQLLRATSADFVVSEKLLRTLANWHKHGEGLAALATVLVGRRKQVFDDRPQLGVLVVGDGERDLRPAEAFGVGEDILQGFGQVFLVCTKNALGVRGSRPRRQYDLTVTEPHCLDQVSEAVQRHPIAAAFLTSTDGRHLLGIEADGRLVGRKLVGHDLSPLGQARVNESTGAVRPSQPRKWAVLLII